MRDEAKVPTVPYFVLVPTIQYTLCSDLTGLQTGLWLACADARRRTVVLTERQWVLGSGSGCTAVYRAARNRKYSESGREETDFFEHITKNNTIYSTDPLFSCTALLVLLFTLAAPAPAAGGQIAKAKTAFSINT